MPLPNLDKRRIIARNEQKRRKRREAFEAADARRAAAGDWTIKQERARKALQRNKRLIDNT